MSLVFQHPYAALLLLLLPLLWWRVAERGSRLHPWLRAGLLVCVVLAMMQPSLVYRSARASAVFVIDQGARLPEADKARARDTLQARLAQAKGANTTVIQLGGAPLELAAGQHVRLDGPADAASLSAALSQALYAIPHDGSGTVTLIGDGLTSDRHWGPAVAALVRRGIPVDTLALDPPARPAFVGAMRVAPARVGEAVRVSVEIEGEGRGLAVALYAGDTQQALSPAFDVQDAISLALSFPAEHAGFIPLRAVLTDAQGVERDRFDTVAAIQEPLRVLYLGADVAGGEHLQHLLGRGFAVEARGADALGGDFDFSTYRTVFVDDLAPSRLPAVVQQRLADAVADAGTGLVYAGGEMAFGGGDPDTPLARMLPVEFKKEEQLQIPSVALAIVIDSSGSMVGEPMELAKQVARLAVRKLTPDDRAGVVEFYGARQWAVPIQSVRNPQDIERAIGRMQAQGGTELFPAIQEAYFGLKATDTRFRHMLVITDAGVEDENYRQLLRHIAQDRINVSTVLVGGSAQGEERMVELANWGRGRFYAVGDESSLVELNLKQPQIEPTSGYQRGSFPIRLQDRQDWWKGMDLTRVPTLRGYARVGRREQAEMLATAASSDDPLLASWQYGAGRVTALTTEPLGSGTGGWQGWADYGPWLARILARSAAQQPAFDVQLQRRFDELSVQAQRLGAGEASAPTLRLLDPSGKRVIEQVPLDEKTPGLFVAQLPFDPMRQALAEFVVGAEVVRVADRAGSDVRPESRLRRVDALPLARLSQLTGGHHAAAGTPLIPTLARGRGAFDAVALWPWLALSALLLYLTELAYRRWPGSLLWNRNRNRMR
ncbi:hypothetical protein AMP9_4050 [plant metagenome]|uniref:VWFA domain-containing protein n=1 Tax=plant metagenome TaxID=1297885 RepID=A0A484P6T0_9ZZZZ